MWGLLVKEEGLVKTVLTSVLGSRWDNRWSELLRTILLDFFCGLLGFKACFSPSRMGFEASYLASLAELAVLCKLFLTRGEDAGRCADMLVFEGEEAVFTGCCKGAGGMRGGCESCMPVFIGIRVRLTGGSSMLMTTAWLPSEA